MKNWTKKTLFLSIISWALVSGSVASAFQPYPMHGGFYRRVTHTTTTTTRFFQPVGMVGQNPWGCGFAGGCGGGFGGFPYPNYVFPGGCWYGGCGGGVMPFYPRFPRAYNVFVGVGPIQVGVSGFRYY